MTDAETFASLPTTRVQVAAGRRVIRSGDVLTAAVIGESGTVLAWRIDGQLACIPAPFAFGRWACDETGRAILDVFAQTELEILLLPSGHDQSRFIDEPELRSLMSRTRRQYDAAGTS